MSRFQLKDRLACQNHIICNYKSNEKNFVKYERLMNLFGQFSQTFAKNKIASLFAIKKSVAQKTFEQTSNVETMKHNA